MTKFHCTVATPTRGLFSGEIEYAHLPGLEGDLGVMAGHEMYMGLDGDGVVTLWLDEQGTKTEKFAVSRGFAQVTEEGHLFILGRFGCHIDEIDVEHCRARRKEFIEKVAELKQQPDSVHAAVLQTHEKHLVWCETRLKAVGAEF